MLKDEEWQGKYPEAYKRFRAVYRTTYRTLHLAYLKQIRRHKFVKVALFDLTTARVTTVAIFVLNKDGTVSMQRHRVANYDVAWTVLSEQIEKDLAGYKSRGVPTTTNSTG